MTNQPATATLFLNGQSMGSIVQPMRFSWDAQKGVIMIGIECIGDMDELMIFDQELSADAIKSQTQGL